MQNIKWLWNWLFGGAVIGMLVTSWLAPKVIIWYFTPPVDYGINCSLPITWALTRLRYVQMVGLGSGALLGLLGSLIWARKRKGNATGSIQ